jgi:putative ABC transport system permease protein
VSISVRPRPASVAPSGGAPARRAVIRWAWRLYRREWRQQLAVLGLLTVTVAAATFGIAFAALAPSSPDAEFGTANHMLTITGPAAQQAAGVSVAARQFDEIEVIKHASAAIPGSVNTVDVRSEQPDGRFSSPMLRLDAGHYPAPGQVAVTSGVAAIYRLRIGSSWREGGRQLQVVGIVENPANLQDQFALVAPGQVGHADRTTVLFDATVAQARAFRRPSGSQLTSRPPYNPGFPPAAILLLDTIALLFVGLIALAGFTVMAQRRLRALGMLAAVGATDRHVRLVLLANGAVVGAVAAVIGAVAALAGWAAFAPYLATAIVEHRIDTFGLPWWEVIAAVLLAVVTATAAAWWPARVVSRVAVVAALSGRPTSPRQGRRPAAVGGVLLAVGLAAIAFCQQGKVPPLVIGGLILTAAGVLLLGPVAIGALAALASYSPIAVRLALRDLSRYRARSGAALAAISLVTGIVAAIAVSAAASAENEGSPGAVGWANLPANQLMIYLSPAGSNGPPEFVPALKAGQIAQYRSDVNGLAAALHSQDVVPLDAAVAPGTTVLHGGQPNGRPSTMLANTQGGGHGPLAITPVAQLYVATPALLLFYRVDPAAIRPATDVITARAVTTGAGPAAVKIVDFAPIVSGCPTVNPHCPASGSRPGHHPSGKSHVSLSLASPVIQQMNLPRYTSAPNTLLTMHALATLGLKSVLAGWLIETPAALTPAQVTRADHWAAAHGLTVETASQSPEASLATVSDRAIAAGVLAVLAVLAMTIGLIRSETATDLRVLSATGASGSTRRMLTGATAAALALLGGLLGTAAAYLAIVAWNRGVHSLASVPLAKLAILVLAVPLVALVAGWLLAGREPQAIDRQPLE